MAVDPKLTKAALGQCHPQQRASQSAKEEFLLREKKRKTRKTSNLLAMTSTLTARARSRRFACTSLGLEKNGARAARGDPKRVPECTQAFEAPDPGGAEDATRSKGHRY